MQEFKQGRTRLSDGALPGAWWQVAASDTERIDCLLCPRQCSLKDGDRGFCFVRENRGGQMVLSTYGKSTGFCIDPVEKKPLNHFHPGTSVLSFGTAGCNLGCQFCQNWDISKSREVQKLSSIAEPETIAAAAAKLSCRSVAFTYNDPVVWAEYAIDTAKQCRAAGIKTVAVTAGYIAEVARAEFFAEMDAANVDLKAFSEEFYRKITYSHLQPVLETIKFLKRETDVWFELTNLLIPNVNDSSDELRRMCGWILDSVGDSVPIHYSAFHPDFRMRDRPRTDPETLNRAYGIAKSEGLKFPYVGNVHDVDRQSTYCAQCGRLLIERDWYQLGIYALDAGGCCTSCGASLPGHFDAAPGTWGSARQPVRIEQFADSNDRSFVPVDRIALTSGPKFDRQLSRPTIPEVTLTKEAEMTTTPSETSSTGPATQPRVAPKPLNIERINPAQQAAILDLAATSIATSATGHAVQVAAETLANLEQTVVMGAFVTLKRGNTLRGCCGVLGQPMTLGSAVSGAAQRTAKQDQRLAPISPSELPFLALEVTLLGPMNKVDGPAHDRPKAVTIGKHGVVVQRGQKSGLLLPSVATERNWDAERFLQAASVKAGLPAGAWESDEATVLTFGGETLACSLADRLPLNLPRSLALPLSTEQLSQYAQVAGQNIVAMLTGGTPSYVVPHLPDTTCNAIVLSMQWESVDTPGQPRQGNALQVSFRPGVALQSTLFQMCQQAADAFRRQRFNGQLHIGLTLGFDPALHGQGVKAELDGVDAGQRALIISDPRTCGFAFDPSKTPEELRDLLRSNLPIGTRDAGVHSMQVTSTLPSVICVSTPNAISATGARAAAFAGKLYPAEDAARRAMLDKLLAASESDPSQSLQPLAIMVPHAALKHSGQIAAEVWRSVKDLNGKTIIIVSPKHTNQGVNWSVCPFDAWQISNTKSIASDQALAKSIADQVDALQLDAAAHQLEHGIEVQLPLLERLAPDAKVIGLALHGGSWHDIQVAAEQMALAIKSLDKMPLLVISSDMNHFAPENENRRRDRLALNALATGDPQQLIAACEQHDISMCGLVPCAFVMETLRKLGADFEVIEIDYATSAETSGDKSQVVGYAGVALVPASASIV